MKKFSICLFFLSVFFTPLFAYDYLINEMNVNVEVGKNAVHKVTEDYNIYFSEPRHGIIRMIPVLYNQEDVRVTAKVLNIQCSTPFESEVEDGTMLIRLGDEHTLVRGDKSYSLKYDYDLPEDVNDGYDDFYFNLLGDGWDVPVLTFNFSVFIPISLEETRIWITSGRYGSRQPVPFNIKEVSDGIIISGTVSELMPNEAVTIRAEFPDNWYEGARKLWDYREQFRLASFFVSCFGIIIGIIVYMKYGRRNPLVITARFEPPEGFNPMMVSQLLYGKFNQKDLTAMIFYWADKGYLKITEEKKGYFVFTKLSDLPSSASDHERDLFYGFFRGVGINEKIDIKKINSSSFYTSVENAKTSLKNFFTGAKELYNKKGKSKCSFLTFISLFPIFSCVFGITASELEIGRSFVFIFVALMYVIVYSGIVTNISIHSENNSISIPLLKSLIPVILAVFGAYFFLYVNFVDFDIKSLIVSVLSSSLICFLGSLCIHLTDYGKEKKEHVLGLKEFISKAEIDQLKRMIDDNPEYYFHILSYAIVLNLEDKWAKKFDSIRMEQPSWYVSDYGLINAYLYSSLLSHMSRNLNLSRAEIRSGRGTAHIGGGGFGSSGFSGGGFGGGGGRSW